MDKRLADEPAIRMTTCSNYMDLLVHLCEKVDVIPDFGVSPFQPCLTVHIMAMMPNTFVVNLKNSIL